MIAEGELVDGIGGGTCQISGTLHGAAFFAGLEIVERYPHTRPSCYIKMGLDATVVYPTINFRFKNPFDFPVVLHETVKNGVVRAEILGTQAHAHRHAHPPHRRRGPVRRGRATRQGLARGRARARPARHRRASSCDRYRIVRDGAHAVRERWNDVYPPTQQIVRVGTGQGARELAKVEDDPHPEYVADELLVLTQGPDVESTAVGEGGGGHYEYREPGRFGDYGWTEKAGMPFWRGDGSKPVAEGGEEASAPRP